MTIRLAQIMEVELQSVLQQESDEAASATGNITSSLCVCCY